MPELLFLLGVNDPEMRRIEELLAQEGAKFQYAMSGGRRVHPGNAYKADPIELTEETLVLVECEPTSIPDGVKVVRVDHHRPGDKGYGMPAINFLNASSLGQLAGILEIIPLLSQDDIVLAAMDHCPANAIRGECPGVSAEEVLNRKVSEIASDTKHTKDYVRGEIEYMTIVLETAPDLTIGNSTLKDTRDLYLGEGYNVSFLAMQVAALAGGYVALLRHRDPNDTSEKWSISGHATPELIEAFMNNWATSPLTGFPNGLVRIYGVPMRGYAGGYVPESN